MAGELGELRVGVERIGGQVEQPGGDHAAAPPDFGDIGQRQVVLVVLGIAHRRGLGVQLVGLLADVGVLQDRQAFGIGGHHPVLDAVVDHLDEVAGAVRPAMQVALLGGAVALATGGARDVADAGRQGLEDRVEAADHVGFAADHHAIAPVEAEHAAAGADVDIVDLLRGQFLGAADVVDVVGVAAVDQDVAGFEQRQQVGDRRVDHRGRHHQPQRPRLGELGDLVLHRGGAGRALFRQRVHRGGGAVEDHAFVAALHQAADHVGAHAAQADHSELHRCSSRGSKCADGADGAS